jgi:hypothetical protein
MGAQVTPPGPETVTGPGPPAVSVTRMEIGMGQAPQSAR